uniref:DNA polymerase IV n=1 Tax=Thermorudis peleae TaxID=1382356 RepID=A0A831X0B1_9BACT
MDAQRAVLHADLDAFFAAAEVRRRPELAGKPLIVGGRPGGRGVVSSASYEARRYGIRSGMPIRQAERLCPQAVFLPVDFAYYRELAAQFRAILSDLSSLVEHLSIDEACLELGPAPRWPEEPAAAGRRLRQRVRAELGLNVTVGIATNRTVAKVAADLAKPDGLRLIPPGQEATFLAPLPVDYLPGIGPNAARRLRELGVRTLGQLAQVPPYWLRVVFGRRAEEVHQRAQGIDPRPVTPEERAPKSIGHERTFHRDLSERSEIRQALRELSEKTAREMRLEGLQGQVVSVKVRFDDFTTLGRQRRLARPTIDGREIAEAAVGLAFELLDEWRRPVRLLGVRVSGLAPLAVQLALFDPRPLRALLLLRALDRLAARRDAAGASSRRPGTALGYPVGPARLLVSALERRSSVTEDEG